MLINTAARVISGCSRFDHITDFVKDALHWLPITQTGIFQSVHFGLYICLYICVSDCRCCLSLCLSVCPSDCLSVCLSVSPSACLSVCQLVTILLSITLFESCLKNEKKDETQTAYLRSNGYCLNQCSQQEIDLRWIVYRWHHNNNNTIPGRTVIATGGLSVSQSVHRRCLKIVTCCCIATLVAWPL